MEAGEERAISAGGPRKVGRLLGVRYGGCKGRCQEVGVSQIETFGHLQLSRGTIFFIFLHDLICKFETSTGCFWGAWGGAWDEPRDNFPGGVGWA